ncbi:hypothetical protein [Sphingobium cloacae]|uniref:Uncharacterized protein n=1 Tax=Sphingobium cloacae TaxID=120107 RepID=A0A1E1F209_9SPHN|nr:hypothetical protein [Sphingobium cloacae]BAV64559.1 hypothetical protein SCLO_1015190 [Sphingobium cloacae]
MMVYGKFPLSAFLLAMMAAPVSARGEAAVPPATAQDEAAAWTGHYYLQGVMETGSEMLLRPDGRFQWYLVVGSLDLFAEGRWEARDGSVVLTSEPSEDVPKPAFGTMVLRQEEGRLIPGEKLGGAYVRPERDGDQGR